MNIYQDWGFRETPFSTMSLAPNEMGESLLIGRDTEISSLTRKLFTPPKIPTIEGLNGVGKTSLVNVVAYKAYKSYMKDGIGKLYIPCNKIFQLNPQIDIQTFIDHVLMEVAQTLIDKAHELKENGLSIQTLSIDKWLNSPQLTTYQAGIQSAVFGLQGGASSETNTSSGFERSGFRKLIMNWLNDIFPDNENGGVVCVIDNMELLQSSEKAREILEQLRDELLTLNGLRWVLCGALGIILGVASSPRLDGYLHRPVEVGEISEVFAGQILSSRINAFKLLSDPYLPLIEKDFIFLYEVLHGNLRSLISYSDDYCQWIADNQLPNSNDEKHTAFETWFAITCEAAYQAFKPQITPRLIEVFKYAQNIGGIFSPSDFQEFGFNSIPAFRPHIKTMEEAGVLVSTQDEGDKRRKTIQITPKGWLVADYLKNQ
ncbi:MAG: hypothetical protein AB7U52_06430 [Candidatus Izemoplasmatales bacterium]